MEPPTLKNSVLFIVSHPDRDQRQVMLLFGMLRLNEAITTVSWGPVFLAPDPYSSSIRLISEDKHAMCNLRPGNDATAPR